MLFIFATPKPIRDLLDKMDDAIKKSQDLLDDCREHDAKKQGGSREGI